MILVVRGVARLCGRSAPLLKLTLNHRLQTYTRLLEIKPSGSLSEFTVWYPTSNTCNFVVTLSQVKSNEEIFFCQLSHFTIKASGTDHNVLDKLSMRILLFTTQDNMTSIISGKEQRPGFIYPPDWRHHSHEAVCCAVMQDTAQSVQQLRTGRAVAQGIFEARILNQLFYQLKATAWLANRTAEH